MDMFCSYTNSTTDRIWVGFGKIVFLSLRRDIAVWSMSLLVSTYPDVNIQFSDVYYSHVSVVVPCGYE